jgi:hypothetical protein
MTIYLKIGGEGKFKFINGVVIKIDAAEMRTKLNLNYKDQ